MPDNIQNNSDSDQVSNSVLAVKLDFIQIDLTTIKSDIKEMKASYMPRSEYDIRHLELANKIKDLENEDGKTKNKVSSLNDWQNKIVGALILINILLGILIAYYKK